MDSPKGVHKRLLMGCNVLRIALELDQCTMKCVLRVERTRVDLRSRAGVSAISPAERLNIFYLDFGWESNGSVPAWGGWMPPCIPCIPALVPS